MNWLNSPYPLLEGAGLKMALSFAIGLVCFIFLVVFRPFGLNVVEEITFFAGFGANALISMLIWYFIVPLLFPRFFDGQKWTIFRELTFFICVVFMISIFNYWYNSTVGKDFSPQYSWIRFISLTASVAVLPIILLTYATEKIASKRNQEEAALVRQQIQEAGTASKTSVGTIEIHSSNRGEASIEIPITDFRFAQANGNYSKIVFFKDDQLQTALPRVTLSKILTDNESHADHLVRCHKSYVVGRAAIEAISGNARSMSLTLSGIDSTIPVSRSFDTSMLVGEVVF